MFTCLAPASLYIQLPWRQCLAIARRAGFDGIEIPLEPGTSLRTDGARVDPRRAGR